VKPPAPVLARDFGQIFLTVPRQFPAGSGQVAEESDFSQAYSQIVMQIARNPCAFQFQGPFVLQTLDHLPVMPRRLTTTAPHSAANIVMNSQGDKPSSRIRTSLGDAWSNAGMAITIFAALCGAVVVSLRRHHRQVVERLEHERALELERTRIARDLHDDLGVGLTEIGLLGDLAGTSGNCRGTVRNI